MYFRYAKLYPNRLELHSESNKPELTFMDQVDEINTDLTVQVKCEQCIMLKTKDGAKVVITSGDEVGLKEWAVSLNSAYKTSQELFSGLAKKAGKIYGTAMTGSAAAAAATSASTSLTALTPESNHHHASNHNHHHHSSH